jgi:hypothetical protein
MSLMQIPWLGLIIEQVHLLRKEFNSSFWEIPQAGFRPQ